MPKKRRNPNNVDRTALRSILVRLTIWVPSAMVVSAPLIWWLTQTQITKIALDASCEELVLNSLEAMGLTANTISKIKSYGFSGVIENATEIRVKNSQTKTLLPLNVRKIELEEREGESPPAISAILSGSTGLFLASFSGRSILKKAISSDTEDGIQIQSLTQMAQIEAEQLVVDAERLRFKGSTTDMLNIQAESKTGMARLFLHSLPDREPTLIAQFPPNTILNLIRKNPAAKMETEHKACHKIDIYADGSKLPIPSVKVSDVKLVWDTISAFVLSIKSDSVEKAIDLSFQASGDAVSVTYDNEQMNKNNLEWLASLSIEKKGVIGFAWLSVVWFGKQLFERICKRLFDIVFLEKAK